VRAMPVVKYFVVAGLALVSLLFVADALFSRPENPVYAAKFDRRLPASPGGAVMSRDLALLPSPPPHIATVPAEPDAAATKPAATAARSEPEATPANQAAAKEQPTKKRRVAHRPTRPQVARDVDRAERWQQPGRRQQAPWDDSFAFAPRNDGPFWFR